MLFVEHFFLFELFPPYVAECYLLVSCDAQATTQNIQSYGLMIIVWYLNLNLFQVKCPEYWSLRVHYLWKVSFTVFMYVYVQTYGYTSLVPSYFQDEAKQICMDSATAIVASV